jgi:hypothetical protein
MPEKEMDMEQVNVASEELTSRIAAKMKARGIPEDRHYAIADALGAVEVAGVETDNDKSDEEAHRHAQDALNQLSSDERAVANEILDEDRK